MPAKAEASLPKLLQILNKHPQQWGVLILGFVAVLYGVISWLPLSETTQTAWLRFLTSLPYVGDRYLSPAAMGTTLLIYWGTRDARNAGRDIQDLWSKTVFKLSPRVIEKYTRQAREEERAQWKKWVSRAEEARQQGIPFDEPMPGETTSPPKK